VRIDALARRPAGRSWRPADVIALVIVAEIVIHTTWTILRLTNASRMMVLEFVWTLGALYGLAAIGKLARQYRVEREAAGSIHARELPVPHAYDAREKEGTQDIRAKTCLAGLDTKEPSPAR
jgi:hypothetical protein